MKQILSKFFENALKTKDLNPQEQADLVNYFVGDGEIKLENLRQVDFKQNELTFLAEHLLSTDSPLFLGNFLRYQLFFENYDAIIFLMSKIFVSHIGKNFYSSKNFATYDNLQKTFDRFVEACFWTEIPFCDWQKMFLSALKTNNGLITKWKIPAKSYLLDWSVKDEKGFYDFLFNNFESFGMVVFNLLLESEFSSIAVSKLLDFWLNNSFEEERQVKNILKSHFEEVQKYVQELEKNKEISNANLIKVLLVFDGNVDARNKLISIFEKEKDLNLKKLILENTDIVVQNRNLTLAQAKKNSQKFVGMEDLFLGLFPKDFPKLILKNGEAATDEFVAYYLHSYKNLISPKASLELEFFKNLLQEESMNNFSFFVAEKLVKNEKDDWAFCLIQNVNTDFAVKIMRKMYEKSDLISLAKFLRLFVQTQKSSAISIFNSFKRQNAQDKKIQDEMLKIMIESKIFSSDEIEGLKDRVVPNFDIDQFGVCKFQDFELKVNFDFEVDIQKSLGQDIPKNVEIEQKRLSREIQRQTKRLEKAFHNARMWTEKDFDQFIVSNNLMCFLSQNLLWGRYDKGSLVSVFCLKGKEKHKILSIESKSDCEIGLFHPVELDDYDVKAMFPNGKKAPFNQLYVQVSKISSYNPHSSFVAKFNGFLVNFESFFEKIKKLGWKTAIPTVDGLISKMQKTNEDLGLIAEIGFSPVCLEKLGVNAVMGELRFYNLKDVIKTGNNFVVSKANSLELLAVPKRFFSDIIFEINIATKK